METVKQEIAACEKEITDIKGALRNLGMSRDDERAENILSVVLSKTEGLPEGAAPILMLQLSSPIEEATISKIFNETSKDDATMTAVFKGVQVNQATLSVTAKDADIPLGSSAALDLESTLSIDPLKGQKDFTSNVAVPIKADDSGEVVCTMHLRLTLDPSPKELRENLYEMLNQTSQRKAAALQKLRQSAMESNRQALATKKPAVKPGFLNKSKAGNDNKFVQFYQKWFGPQSMVRKIYPIAKNYVIFAFAVGLCHFKGQLLALPPPV